ncbi:unnamed protein product [Brachionus calyciflorus]|uniref:Uncharacterized protein n=1 Tax=Brachionus calyciflorus TaxID=104777 RepID=A0A814Q2A4_9BILA|nr:unnamed protein product [Brachionus calyciflorus]
MKISKETRKFIEKRLNIESNEPIQELNNEVICLESRFNSIRNQKFYPENYFINKFRKSELVDDFESLSPSYDSISFKNYNEQNVIISKNSPVEIFLNHLSFNNCYLPKDTSKIDLIDITDL